jgi:hypothetical protein
MKKLLVLLFTLCILKNSAQIKSGGTYKDYFQAPSPPKIEKKTYPEYRRPELPF